MRRRRFIAGKHRSAVGALWHRMAVDQARLGLLICPLLPMHFFAPPRPIADLEDNVFNETRSGTRLRQLDQRPPTRAHEAIEADQD